jgi:hypothetical protein
MKIKGFWHIYMINHYYTIITDQLRTLLTSGLYDVCEEINIGCLGTHQEKQNLEKFIVNVYPKIKIKYHAVGPWEYEFPTIKLIEDDNSVYVGFYFHTKAVTRPSDVAQNNLRSWLNEAILNRWQLHFTNVISKYDLSSVNRMYEPDHFNGNFWWFNREYINKLPKIASLDHKDRFMAEQWCCKYDKKRVYAEEFLEGGRDTFKIQYNVYK